jgi:hypothetical protein
VLFLEKQIAFARNSSIHNFYLYLLTTMKMKEALGGFMNFIKEQNIIGAAVGIIM